MNFLLFRGTFLNYSQLRNTVEDSCKSLGQTPSKEQEQPTHPPTIPSEWLVERSSSLRKQESSGYGRVKRSNIPTSQAPQHSRLTRFRQPVHVSISAI